MLCPRTSYNAEIAFSDDQGDWVAEVTVYPVASGDPAEVTAVYPDGPDRNAEENAAALKRLLEDPKALEKVLDDAMESASEAEYEACEEAYERRGEDRLDRMMDGD